MHEGILMAELDNEVECSRSNSTSSLLFPGISWPLRTRNLYIMAIIVVEVDIIAEMIGCINIDAPNTTSGPEDRAARPEARALPLAREIAENHGEHLAQNTPQARRIFAEICSSPPPSPSINTSHPEESPSNPSKSRRSTIDVASSRGHESSRLR
ncbi:hypothetical protein F511_12328 [Dorcoceras hygrometricum]|uniref:Uncharacterized protein n=1 Tax=Dorcoceras hygrometricum TaxID=472368 RepID=A0A2Z7BJT9_9LAMI|nr:hypothetical protein F511_12328 [Dorcoceras hygrometricum]